MIGVSTTPLHISALRKRNVWYSVKDGDWNDPTTWMSNGKRKYQTPQSGDVVYVQFTNTVTFSKSISLKDLYIYGTLRATNGININIEDNLQAVGKIDFATGNPTVNLILNGYANFVSTFISGTSSTVTYNGKNYQDILPLEYWHFSNSSPAVKRVVADLSIKGNCLNKGVIELHDFDLTIDGSFDNQGTLSKEKPGSVIFTSISSAGKIRFNVGNPTIEFKGTGFRLVSPDWQLGTNTVTFSTNNQILKVLLGIVTFNNPIIIRGDITVTNTTEGLNSSTMNISNSIDGQKIEVTDNPTFANSGVLNFISPPNTMSTAGTFNWNYSNDSVVGYLFNGDFTLPFTSYNGLVLGGVGTKTLNSHTSVSYSTTIRDTCKLELGEHNFSTGILSIAGSNQLPASNTSQIIKSGPGSVIFNGLVTGGGYIDFSVGNPTVEFKGGFRFAFLNYLSGTGTHIFSSSNQVIKDVTNTTIFNCPVLISGAITVTHQSEPGGNNSNLTITELLNGTDILSTFDNQAVLRLGHVDAPMILGQFNSGTQVSGATLETKVTYYKSGDQDIYPTTYRNLTLSGSGNKKLLGDVSVNNTYSLTGSAILDHNGFILSTP